MPKPRIGFIGLGIMGKPMSRHLLNAGYELVVHNRSREAVAEIVSEGAQEAHSPKEVAENSTVTITMLPDSPDVESVALGPDGLIEGVEDGDIYIDMSTIAPSVATHVGETLAERGVTCLDAPVSGGDVGAQNATLSIMVGGDEAAFETVKPIFEAMGKNIVLCGPLGAGQTVKACNQVLVAVTIAGVSEALTLGARAGVDPLKVVLRQHPDTTVLDLSHTHQDYTADFYREPAEFVYGWALGGQAYACAFDTMQRNPVLNLDIAGHAQVLTFDPGSTSAHLFSRSVQGGTLRFATEGDDRMRDDRTGALWHRNTGTALEGPLEGTQLEHLVGIVSFTHTWYQFHPDSKTVRSEQEIT